MAGYGSSTGRDIDAYAKENNAIVVDLRSDTLSKPSKAMSLAMCNAVVGDDSYCEDPTVKELETRVAKMLGKEAALFVLSGTMANLIAIMAHCDQRGCEAYCGADSHIFLHEQGGAAHVAGVMLSPIPTLDDGSLDLSILELKIRGNSIHEPTSKLVLLENPTNGQIVLPETLEKLSIFVRKHKLKLHIDGARLWNAVVATKIQVESFVECCDSVTFCLSKGLGAPLGAVLCGSREFIAKSRRMRKVLGGGMRQAGVLAAAGIVALDETIPLLHLDHQRAQKFAKAINAIEFKDFMKIRDSKVQTNMVFVDIRPTSTLQATTIVKKLSLINGPDDPKVIVQTSARGSSLRFVFYRDIDDDMVDAAIRKITYVLTNI